MVHRCHCPSKILSCGSPAWRHITLGWLIGIPILPMHDPAATVKELQRVAKLGLKGALFGVFDAVKPVFHEDWEPVWAVAAAAGIPLSFHLGGGIRSARPTDPSRGQIAAFVSAVPMQLD